MKLIKCPKCGEMYSDSYKTCPFCQEDEALKGRSAAPHRKVTKHRRAPSILGPAMVLVVVLAAVLVGVLLFGGKGSANKPADKPPGGGAHARTPGVPGLHGHHHRHHRRRLPVCRLHRPPAPALSILSGQGRPSLSSPPAWAPPSRCA